MANKLMVNEDLIEKLKKMQKRISQSVTVLSDEDLNTVYGGRGDAGGCSNCNGICEVSCSYYCRPTGC